MEQNIEANEFTNVNELNVAELQQPPSRSSSSVSLTPDQAAVGGTFIKTPAVGESIEFTVKDVNDNPVTDGKDKQGTAFKIGLKRKDNTYLRRDIITTDGATYTINSWEIFYKLFNGEFQEKAMELGTFTGIKVKITRNADGSIARMKPQYLAKIMQTDDMEKVKAEQERVSKLIADKELYTVELL